MWRGIAPCSIHTHTPSLTQSLPLFTCSLDCIKGFPEKFSNLRFLCCIFLCLTGSKSMRRSSHFLSSPFLHGKHRFIIAGDNFKFFWFVFVFLLMCTIFDGIFMEYYSKLDIKRFSTIFVWNFNALWNESEFDNVKISRKSVSVSAVMK